MDYFSYTYILVKAKFVLSFSEVEIRRIPWGRGGGGHCLPEKKFLAINKLEKSLNSTSSLVKRTKKSCSL